LIPPRRWESKTPDSELECDFRSVRDPQHTAKVCESILTLVTDRVSVCFIAIHDKFSRMAGVVIAAEGALERSVFYLTGPVKHYLNCHTSLDRQIACFVTLSCYLALVLSTSDDRVRLEPSAAVFWSWQ
jgi:hypothetical protein